MKGYDIQLNYHIFLERYITMVETLTQIYVAVPQLGPLPLYTKLEGPRIA